MTLVEFLLARIAEDEAEVGPPGPALNDDEGAGPNGIGWADVGAISEVLMARPSRIRAECEAKRRIVELHQGWPVLVTTPPTVEQVSDTSAFVVRASQQMAWLTEQEYRSRFGSEPPTAPMLAALALVYADHPDYDEAWALSDTSADA